MSDQQERLELLKYWFAGIFEGEGWVSLMKCNQRYHKGSYDRYVPVAGMTNTDFTMLERCKEILEYSKIPYSLNFIQPRKKGYKKLWRIDFQGLKKCKVFLEWILPCMQGEKVERTQKIFQFCEWRSNQIIGFRGIPYSEEMKQIYESLIILKSSTTKRQTPKGDDIV